MSFEVPFGAVDGSNQVFTVSRDYQIGSVMVELNGQLKVAANDDGWVELGGRDVQMKIPPKTGDVVQIYYLFG